MNVTVSPIPATKKELTRYVKFGIDLYKGNPYFVPPLIFDDVNTLTPGKNPAFEFSEAQSFMAYRDGKPAGRITAIINRLLNEKTGRQEARFGFVDFIDDPEVSRALFETAEQWARERGMKRIIGPMGFSDMDHEGMLVEGFEEMGTMATIYNYPYYPEHMRRLGFTPEAEWKEFYIKVPERIPEKYQRIADLVQRRFNLKVKKYTSRKKIKEDYGVALFELINEAYDQLYGYSPLTPKQIQYYIDMYLGIINLELVTLITDADDRLIGIGISIQSFSEALQKSRGRLYPTGWWHLLKALRGKSKAVDLLLIAVKPEYQNKGVNALLFADLIPYYNKNGFEHAETNPELADNTKVQNQWEHFDYRQHRRRCTWRKSI